MNAVKIALLGTAALAAVSVSARADDLADLKAQIEALNGRISQLESTPSIPAGYQLMSISQADAIIVPGLDSKKDKIYGKKAHNIGILPTADVPASTNIQWTGFVKAAIKYDNPGGPGNSSVDVLTRAGLKVVGTTDTAVGEVGVRVALISKSVGERGINGGNNVVTTDGYWGWWKITPELTLGGGVDGSLAGNGNGFDGKCSCHYAGGDSSGGYNHNAGGDPSQLRLSYNSGPISFGIALEDHNNVGGKSAFGYAGEMKYAGDMIGFELNAGYWSVTGAGTDDTWTVNAGANMALGDIANLSVAAGVGEDSIVAGANDKYTKASAFLSFTLSDAVSAELGVSHKMVKNAPDTTAIGGGLYYTPVSQLTMGLEAGYAKTGSSKGSNAALVTIWRF